MPVGMHRRDRRPTRRPPLQPTLLVAASVSDYGRQLAAALAAAFQPTCAWQWACVIDVQPGNGPTVTLRFDRHEAAGHPSILDAYQHRWREFAGAPVDDLRGYARAIMAEVAECRRAAVLDHANEWSEATPSHVQPAANAPAWGEGRRGE
jgi:hypothetical protein